MLFLSPRGCHCWWVLKCFRCRDLETPVVLDRSLRLVAAAGWPFVWPLSSFRRIKSGGEGRETPKNGCSLSRKERKRENRELKS